MKTEKFPEPPSEDEMDVITVVLMSMEGEDLIFCQPFEPATMLYRVRGVGMVRVKRKRWKDKNN